MEHSLKFLPITSIENLELAEKLNLEIAWEGLRQARISFNLAQHSFMLSLAMTATSGIISLVGVGLLITGYPSEGSFTTTGGLASSVGFLAISKDARERLEKANIRLDKIRSELIQGL